MLKSYQEAAKTFPEMRRENKILSHCKLKFSTLYSIISILENVKD